jgi:surface polysaccharide O-acyltransferase-like enzyme
MKAIFPFYCKWIGYGVLVLAVLVPFFFMMSGLLVNSDIPMLKEIWRMTVLVGLCLILLSAAKNENEEVARIRTKAMRLSFFFTVIYLVVGMMYRLYTGDQDLMLTSQFIVYLAIHTLTLEFFFHKAKADKMFKR